MKSYMRADTQKKRKIVIETALRMFIDKGFEQVSVDEIIAEAAISKGTFYHYFKSKDEILWELTRNHLDTIEQWQQVTPTKVMSLEGHINRLFLDLASNISKHPRLMQSMIALYLQNKTAQNIQNEFIQKLRTAINYWLPEPHKAELLTITFLGTTLKWCAMKEQEQDLAELLRSNLAWVWAGIRVDGVDLMTDLEVTSKEEYKMKVAIIGGGLAGLTVGAYLSENPNVEGILFERSPQLGGRAFTYEKSGFTLNYGAHALYGMDRHILTSMEKELGLSFSSKSVDKRKVMYAKKGQLTPAPLDFVNLVKTNLLITKDKMRFVGEIAAIMANIHNLRNYATLGDFLAESGASEDVKELWEHLVCSNFFITPEEARKVPGTSIAKYYHNLFLSNKPVGYVLGSWAVITNQLKNKMESSGRFEITLREAAESIRYADRKYIITTKNREMAFDKVIFAMPVQQVIKLLKGTAWEPFFTPYENNTPTEVMVYDIGLDKVVARPFSYISDMGNKMFITDVSATDHTLVPSGGQLLQGVAYLNDDFDNEEDRKAYLDNKQTQMELLFDTYYPGWQEAVAVKRVSKRAMVASVKNINSNNLLPTKVENVPFLFCGDGCEGKGELAERSFSSARLAAQLIINEVQGTSL